MIRVRSSLDDRLRAHSEQRGECLVWTGTIARGRGLPYGRTWDKGKAIPAHRAAYELWVGPIPEGLTIDHLCRNTLCIRPEHLEPVTMRENILRGTGPTAQRAASETCLRGHSLAGDNLATGTFRGYPFRRCRTCWRAAQRDAARRRRERMWAKGLTSKGEVRQRTRRLPMYDPDANGIAGSESDRMKIRATIKGALG